MTATIPLQRLPSPDAVDDIPVAAIGNEAFKDCTNLTVANIPDSITSIGASAFSGCSKLTEAGIPNSIKFIKSYTFSGCTALARIAIPDSVIAIGDHAFSNCTALTVMALPSKISTIEESTFSGCGDLWHIIIPETVTSIAQNAFQDTNLSNVDYSGTKGQWENVGIDSTGNEKLTSSLKNTWKYFNFNNSAESFFENGKITKVNAGAYMQYFDKLMADATHLDLWYFLKLLCVNWSGSCYGISALEGMVNSDTFPPFPVSKIESGKTELPEVDLPCENEQVRDIINFYWLSQYIPGDYRDDRHQKRVGSDSGAEELEKLVNQVLGGTPCMISYSYIEGIRMYSHAFIVEGGRQMSDGNYQLIGRDNNYHGLVDPKTLVPFLTAVNITSDFKSCTIITPDLSKGALRVRDGESLLGGDALESYKVDSIAVYDTFDHFVKIDPTGHAAAVQLLDESGPRDASAYIYILPETVTKDFKLTDSEKNDLANDGAAGNGVKDSWLIVRGNALNMVTDADGSTRLVHSNVPSGTLLELEPASTGSVYTASGINGTCAYIGPEGAAVVSMEDTGASAVIDFTKDTVTLTNNTGEFSITLATGDEDGTVATVTGSTTNRRDTVAVTADDNGGIILDAPRGSQYDVTFETEDGSEATVTVSGGTNVTVANPPVPCDSDAYTARIEWKDGGAYTVTLTGPDSNLTGWQACYGTEGKLLSVAGLAKDGMSFSGKVSQNGTCHLFIVDGNSAPIIQKYNLTK